MASGSYAIKGLQLADIKRVFKVKANRQQARAGDVIKFTITATGVSDRTVRSYYIEGVAPEDLADQKTGGLFYLRQGEAEVYVQIAPDYDNDKDVELVFNVVDSKSTLFRIKRPPQAKVLIKGDGEPSQERDRKRLKDQNRKRLQQGKDGQLARQDPIQRVRVSEVQRKALKYGAKQLPGMGQRALPAGRPRALPGAAAPKALPPVGGMPASRQIVDITPVSKSVRPMGGSLARSGGGSLARSGGGSLARSGSAGALKGVRAPGALGVATAGLEFGSRMNSGQNVVQAGAGTAASVGGGLAGMKAGAAAGAALGSIVPGLGTAIGGILGGILGGMGGSMLASKATDTVTGANRQEFAEGGHIIPKMTDMPFNLPGLKGSFNEPGNPEMLSITPLDDPMKAAQSISGIAQAAGGGLMSMLPALGPLGMLGAGVGGVGAALGGGLKNIFGGKEKEYKGIAKAIGAEMERRGIGDPLGLKGGKSFGNSVRDLLGKIPGIKDIFGNRGGNTQGQQQGTSPGGPGGPGGPGMGDDVFSIISGGEGDVNSVNRGTAGDTAGGAHALLGKNLTDMTVDEVYANQRGGPRLFAVGKYQIIPDTMEGFITYLKGQGIDTSKTNFNEATQDKFKTYVMDVKRPAVGKYIRGEAGSSRDEAAQELAREFASVGLTRDEAGRSRGQSRYAGTGGNAASITPEQIAAGLDSSRNAYANGGLNSPTLSPMGGPQGAGQTVVLAGGTNTAGNPGQAATDMTAAIRNLKNKGYNVVVVPPNGSSRRFRAAYAAIKNSAKQEGVEVVEGVYGGHDGNDEMHLSPQSVQSIQSKYPGAIYMGDSNAVRLNGYITQTGVNRQGAGTGEIKEQAQNFQRAPQAPVNNQNTQLNPGVQQMSYSPSAAVQPQTPQVGELPDPEAATGGKDSKIVSASHPDTGTGYTIDGLKDEQGRPAVFSRGAASAFARMMKDSKGIVKGSDITSSMRSRAKNSSLDGASPTSNHLTGNAIDIHGASKNWIIANGARYGWNHNDYSGGHGGHFDFVGGGATALPSASNASTAGGASSNGVQLMSNTSPAPAGNPEDFFKFAFGAQGRDSSYTAPPNAAPTALLEASSNTAMASAGPKVAVVNNPVSTSTNVSNGGGSQSQQSSRGSDMSDAGLLAYMAKQRLLTLGV